MIRQLAKATAAAVVFGVAVGSAVAQTPPRPSAVVVVPRPDGPVDPMPQPQPQPDQQWKLGVKIGTNAGGGVLIHDVFANSPAEAVGLRPGMVILSIDGVNYDNPLQVREKVLYQSGDTIAIVYKDGGNFYQVTAQLTTTTVVAVAAPGRPAVKTVVPQAKSIKRVQIADPRKK